MTIELYTELSDDIEKRLRVVEIKVQSFPVNKMGLVERTKEFVIARRNFKRVFNELRVLNKHTSNKLKREYSMNKRFNKIQTNLKP